MSYKHSELHHKYYESIPDRAPVRIAEDCAENFTLGIGQDE